MALSASGLIDTRSSIASLISSVPVDVVGTAGREPESQRRVRVQRLADLRVDGLERGLLVIEPAPRRLCPVAIG